MAHVKERKKIGGVKNSAAGGKGMERYYKKPNPWQGGVAAQNGGAN
jgi:hypothetical protein